MDETYIRVGGQWKYLYRAVDRLGQTVDFLLTAKRDRAAAQRFFPRAIDLHDVPKKVTIYKSGANTAAVHGLVEDSRCSDRAAPVQGLEQPRRTGPPCNQAPDPADARIQELPLRRRSASAGIETTHMIRKGQPAGLEGQVMSAAELFYNLAF